VFKWRAVAEPTPVRPDLLQEKDFPVPFGRYTLLGLLGEGGMARVFRGELQGLKGFRKPAALKVIRASVGEQGERLTRALIHEARLGGLLHHPNVVETYDFGEEAGQAWIAMEQVRGVGLDRLLETGRPLPVDVGLEIAAQICAGLHHAHTLQKDGSPSPLVHRDLKPTNVMVADSGLVKVLDFGIAKATHIGGNTTETGLTKGTPAFMSPEQAQGAPVDPRSDIFAAGALLFEMLTGRRFFSGETVYQIMLNVAMVEDRLQDSSLMCVVETAVPGAWTVIQRCLRSDREARYPSALALEQAIRGLQGPVQAPGPVQAWVERRRAEADPRFLPPLPTSSGGPAQLKGSSLLEELSLDAPEALAPTTGAGDPDAGLARPPGPSAADQLAPTRPMAPRLARAGAGPPSPPTRPPAGVVPPTPSAPVTSVPDGATLQPTRLVPPVRRRSRLLPIALGLGGLGLLALAVVVLLAVFWRGGARPDPSASGAPTSSAELPGTDPAGTAVSTDPGTAPSADGQAPLGTPRKGEVSAASPRPGGDAPSRSEPTSTRERASTPAAVREASRPEPTPRPTADEVPDPVQLRHAPPSSVVIGSPTHFKISVEPAGGCRPRLRYAPWDSSDGGWRIQGMSEVGGGQWETELHLPYEVVWKSGFRYQLRCEDAGRVVAAWPGSGSQKVPALAR
jgi:serine/threonine protein kinase